MRSAVPTSPTSTTIHTWTHATGERGRHMHMCARITRLRPTYRRSEGLPVVVWLKVRQMPLRERALSYTHTHTHAVVCGAWNRVVRPASEWATKVKDKPTSLFCSASQYFVFSFQLLIYCCCWCGLHWTKPILFFSWPRLCTGVETVCIVILARNRAKPSRRHTQYNII